MIILSTDFPLQSNFPSKLQAASYEAFRHRNVFWNHFVSALSHSAMFLDISGNKLEVLVTSEQGILYFIFLYFPHRASLFMLYSMPTMTTLISSLPLESRCATRFGVLC
jgi:hypothetical protein